MNGPLRNIHLASIHRPPGAELRGGRYACPSRPATLRPGSADRDLEARLVGQLLELELPEPTRSPLLPPTSAVTAGVIVPSNANAGVHTGSIQWAVSPQ